MARAFTYTEQVKVRKKVPVTTYEVQETTEKRKRVKLVLSEGDADFLLAVLARIGGHRTKSPRKYATRIFRALTDATDLDYTLTDAWQLGAGTIMFANYSDPGPDDGFA